MKQTNSHCNKLTLIIKIWRRRHGVNWGLLHHVIEIIVRYYFIVVVLFPGITDCLEP
jgi:hypothetical protein